MQRGLQMDDASSPPDSAERVRAHITALTRAQFQDLTRRLVLYAARLLRGASLDHHAYDIVTGAMDLALAGSRTWDPRLCPFENFLFGVVRSRASILRNSAATRVVKIAAQLPSKPHTTGRARFESVADDSPRAQLASSVEQDQEIEHLMLSMARISETLAQVFILAIYEGRSNIDIANQLQLSVGDVVNSKKRLQRALRKLYPAGSERRARHA
jgi:DNA-directed RNA polymerase specialized sigma24 family protein